MVIFTSRKVGWFLLRLGHCLISTTRWMVIITFANKVQDTSWKVIITFAHKVKDTRRKVMITFANKKWYQLKGSNHLCYDNIFSHFSIKAETRLVPNDQLLINHRFQTFPSELVSWSWQANLFDIWQESRIWDL